MSRESWGTLYSDEEREMAAKIDKIEIRIIKLSKIGNWSKIEELRRERGQYQRKLAELHRENYGKLW